VSASFIFIIVVQGAAGMNIVETFNQTQTATGSQDGQDVMLILDCAQTNVKKSPKRKKKKKEEKDNVPPPDKDESKCPSAPAD
jgi:enolase